MNRRRFLVGSAAYPVVWFAGCLGEAGDDSFPDPEDDPFPMDVEMAERGGDETVVSKTVGGESEYEDASIECADEAWDAVRERLEAELDDLRDVGIGRGRGPGGFDGMAVTVHLTTAAYDRDGKLIREADLEFEELVAVTPPTAYLHTEDGERLCAVPVYVEQAEAHVD